jgi:hypothetical protein
MLVRMLLNGCTDNLVSKESARRRRRGFRTSDRDLLQNIDQVFTCMNKGNIIEHIFIIKGYLMKP